MESSAMADAKKILHSAEIFRLATRILATQIEGGHPSFLAPYGVNAAFTLELYLKCLLTLERGSPPRGHNLLQLFNKVRPANQARIRVYYDNAPEKSRQLRQAMQAVTGLPSDFDSDLKASQRAFELMRYHWEGTWELGTGWSAGDITESVRHVIFEIRPDWAREVSRAEKVVLDAQPTSPTR
jgi:hypothetical protein